MDAAERLAAQLQTDGAIRSRRVAQAFARVARHEFVPHVSVAQAYVDRAIPIKSQHGAAISSASQPAIVAEMLESLDLAPGARVLEIGTGSGYNAALLAEVVGPDGLVVSLDLEDDLVLQARARLDRLGYRPVVTRCADGALGDPEHAPFDAIVATVAVADIPAAWSLQLRPGGRLVVPLALGLVQKVICFERTADALRSRGAIDAAFVLLRGPAAASYGRLIPLSRDDLAIRVREDAPPFEAAALLGALHSPERDVAPERRLTLEDVWSGLGLWLSLRAPAFCKVMAEGPQAMRGPLPSLLPSDVSRDGHAVTFGLVAPDSLALFALASHDERRILVRQFGPGEACVAELQREICAWHEAGRPRNERLHVEVYPHALRGFGPGVPARAATIVTQRSSDVAISWQ